MSETVIETQDLTKIFLDKPAVDSLSLNVPQGSVFGFLGVNGAGKTTAIRAVMGHLHPTKGVVRTLGCDPREHTEDHKRRIAYVSENMGLPGWMTAERAVRFCETLYPAWDEHLAEILLDEFELRGAGPYKNLSKGQKRRANILLALAQNAELIVMDEPGAGLDVVARHGLLSRILDIACEGGRTVFLSSHLLSDLERIVDRIAIIGRGRLMICDELDSLKRKVREIQLPVEISKEALAETFHIIRYESGEGRTSAVALDFDDDRFRDFCGRHQCAEGASDHGFNLEDLFVELETHRDAVTRDGKPGGER